MSRGRPARTGDQQIVLDELGKNIVRLRTAEGLTQDDLAARLGPSTDRVGVSLAENGKTDMSTTRLLDYARALGVTPNDLLAGVLGE